jgi:hypothetical protein
VSVISGRSLSVHPILSSSIKFFRYRSAFKEYVENLARRQMQVPVDNMAWMTWAHVVNLRVLPHKDKQDAENGWVGMTPLGEYGGELLAKTKMSVPVLKCAASAPPLP